MILKMNKTPINLEHSVILSKFLQDFIISRCAGAGFILSPEILSTACFRERFFFVTFERELDKNF